MSIVRFEAKSDSSHTGYRLGSRIVDLTTAPIDSFSKQSGLIDYISHIDHLEDYIWETVAGTIDEDFLYEFNDVTLDIPVAPPKVLCLEGCYRQDLIEDDYDPLLADEDYHQQDWPSISVAPTSALCAPGDPLRIPSYAEDVRPGLEVGFVVGERARNIDPERAMSVIAGYTIVTSLRIFDGVPNLEGYKMYDGSFACGPVIVPLSTEDVNSLTLILSVNGEREAVHDTSEWRFTAGELVSEASQVLTLEPGDLLTTGSPTRIEQPVTDGESVTARIEGAGKLWNPIAQEPEDV